MTLVRVATASGTVSLTGTGYRPEGGVLGEPSADALLEVGLVLVGGSVANDARLQGGDEAGAWEIHGDPTDAAFLVALRKVRGATERVDSFERCGEVPFTSERKLMSVLSRDLARGGHRLFTKGAPDVLLERCSFRRLGDDVEPLDEDGRAAVAGRSPSWPSRASVPSGWPTAPSTRTRRLSATSTARQNPTWCCSGWWASSTHRVRRPPPRWPRPIERAFGPS
jgi:hypothetical protein